MANGSKNILHLESGNRLEILTFGIGSQQLFGINVLKVKEIIPCPELVQVPSAHPAVRGVAHLRGKAITVIDLAKAMGRRSSVGENCSVIITEINRFSQGFLVNHVERIIYCDWKDVLPPPVGTGSGSYITGVTQHQEHLLEIVDVEKVMAEVLGSGSVTHIPAGISEAELERIRGRRVMVVDDSSLARSQTSRTLEAIGIECVMARDGKEALQQLVELHAEEGGWPVDLVISDIEMPEMDGYTLTREIRNHAALKGLYVVLHTSLTGAINTEMATLAGADDFLTKFDPDDLAQSTVKGLSR